MAFDSHVSSVALTSNGRGNLSTPAAPIMYGRVIDIILSFDDPRCTDASKINGVYYRITTSATNEEDIDKLNFAFQGSATSRQLPLIGEIVTLSSNPGATSLHNPGVTQTYWTSIVSVWNHPHHNASPDTKQLEWKSNLLGVPEQRNINPLQANSGDYLLEGRLGNTIRLGGYKGKNLDLIDDTNNGKPVILISNGQINTTNGSDLIYEDINKDSNSLYFLSDHKVNLLASNTKRDSYNTLPLTSDKYKGNQILMNADRVYLNAKQDSVLISGKESVGINANSVNIDSTEYFCVDSKKVYLGAGARKATTSFQQPAVLGKQLENWLGTLLATLETVANAMSSASAVGAGAVISLNVAGPSVQAAISTLKTQYALFQSKKVFTE